MTKALAALLAAAALVLVGTASGSTPGGDVRLSNDCQPGACSGYVSDFTLVTGQPYTDATLTECSIAHGRQNEPAVAVDPRDTRVLLGSSNDYCGVYSRTDANGNPVPTGPVWLGYYRSETSGSSFVSSLVPGYPDDRSQYAQLSQARESGAGDPVIAWDAHGRAFFGSEASGDPAGTAKTFGDAWVARFRNPDPPGPGQSTLRDGLEYYGTTIVAKGSSAPNLLGKFNDKTSIEADRTGGACDGNVYFSWSRFTGNGGVGIYFVRSTDHGVTFSSPLKLSASIHDVQYPDISVTGNGHVYVTFRQFASQGHEPDAIDYVKSTDCGATFSKPQVITTFEPYDAQDVAAPAAAPMQSQPDDPTLEDTAAAPGSTARDCGDFTNACASGYTFFRRDTQVRSTADQLDRSRENVYVVYDPSKPGTETPTGTTYGSIQPGTGSQSAVYFLVLDGATETVTTGPKLLDDEATGHQLFPDISADGGVLHALWWDSRFDPCYSRTRPVGNCADRSTVPSVDVFATSSHDRGANWTTAVPVTDVRSNPNYEQYADRTIPFAGDYLWVTSQGDFSFGVWTDWRNTVPGADPRESGDADADAADVTQCRVQSASGAWSGDRCPHAGGLDADIYGDATP